MRLKCQHSNSEQRTEDNEMRAAVSTAARAAVRHAVPKSITRALATHAVAVHANAKLSLLRSQILKAPVQALVNGPTRCFATDPHAQSQSFANPESMILENALNHVSEHGYEGDDVALNDG